MDVDEEQNGDEHAYPSPEQVPSPIMVTNGPSEGTQVDKVIDLSSEATFLELSNDPSSSGTILLHCEFNPSDATILAAAGTDALARMWRLSRTMPDSDSDSPGKPVFISYNNLLDESVPPTTTATGLSWSPDGSLIAVASEPVYEGTSKVEFWSADGKSFTSYNQFDSPILCLQWNLTNTACLSLSPHNEGRGTTIAIMIPTMGESVQFILPHRALLEQPLDAAWVTEEEFFVCGGDVLQGFIFTNNTISLGRKFETRENDGLSKVTYDWRSRLLATASDSGTIDVRVL